MMKQAKSVLKAVFGYDAFISLQESIIGNVLRKNDTLVLMPTGGGKSICYQIPALVFEGLTILISPLISLMKDQVAQLEAARVRAALLNSSLSTDQYRHTVSRIKERALKLLYLAPETLMKANVLSLLSSIPVDCIAIDEAHCISTVEKSCPKAYQSENCRIRSGRWQSGGRFSFSNLAQLCDPLDRLWINGFHSYGGCNDRIPISLAETEITSSLCLIKTEELCIVVADDSRGLPKVTARFIYEEIKYWLTVTDPDIEKEYFLKGSGEYPITSSPVYLTVSISEPFEGFCYKLVARIIFQPDMET